MGKLPQPAEESIALRNIRWETYESLLVDLADCSAPRLTYDRGTLEVMSPFMAHEVPNRSLAQVVDRVTEAWEWDSLAFGSTTFKRRDLACGFDPDSCFYIQNAERLRATGWADLAGSPPPDLVFEINIDCPSLPKLPIYARFGVPEVWRYDGNTLAILTLAGGAYRERDESAALPGLGRATLFTFVEESRRLRWPDWARKVRNWAQDHRPA